MRHIDGRRAARKARLLDIIGMLKAAHAAGRDIQPLKPALNPDVSLSSQLQLRSHHHCPLIWRIMV